MLYYFKLLTGVPFLQAKKHGAQPMDASARDADKSGDSRPKYFGGGGYKLGESEETSEFVPGAEEAQDSRPVRYDVIVHTIRN